MSIDVAPKPVLVIGGGVAGQRAALDLAQVGLRVLLIERSPSLGGTAAQLGSMFPLHNCLLCRGEAYHGPGCTRPTISPQLLDHTRPDGLAVWTRSRLIGLEGSVGAFEATIRREPRYVHAARCIGCDRCAQVCPQELPDPFQAGLVRRKAIYKPAHRAVPDAYVVDKGDYCAGCGRCASVCPTEAIALDQKAEIETLAVSAVILASGMSLYDAALSQEYGYGRYANVYTGLELERMASPAGPGEGRILRRNDGLPPRRIAWLQCVGSRDKIHDYCSSFCCGYATRQAVLARQLLPQAEARIYLMDDRVFGGSFSATYDPLRAAYGIRLERCRPSVLREDPASRDLLLQVPDESGRILEERYGMVVLSVGAVAGDAEVPRILGLTPDEFGFVRTRSLAPVDTSREGIYAAGAVTAPADIADSVTQGSAAAARVCSALGYRPANTESWPGLSTRPEASLVPDGARRIGVLVCDCAGEIGGVVDLKAVLGPVASLPNVVAVRVVPYGCLPEGLDALRAEIRGHALTDVVVGACNPRTYAPLFERELPAGVQFVSLREECAYVHGDDPAGATRLAREMLRQAIVRAQVREPLVPTTITPKRAALVVGGGLAGLTATLHLADAGLNVCLVERERTLGGTALRLSPTSEGEDISAAVQELIARIHAQPRVAVYTATEVLRHAGRLGQFTATLRALDAPHTQTEVHIGATVMATGGEEYRGPVYGLGELEQVMTLLDLEQRLAADPGLPSGWKEIVLVGCVGPWDEPQSRPGAEQPAWRCSRTCCEGIIARATALKKANPACQVIVLHREINTYGFREQAYTAARRAGVLFVRYEPADKPHHERDADGLRVTVRDPSLGEILELHPDLLILGTATLPRADAARTAAVLDIPQLEDGFYRAWEAKTQPYASLQPGVFVCGLAHGPQLIRETIAQALAAARHAAGLLVQKQIVRSGVVAQVDGRRCVGCLTCVRVCPYGVPRIDDRRVGQGGSKSKSYIDPVRCQGCGTCVADCPGKAIRLAGYGEEQLVEAGVLGRWLSA